MSALYTPAMLGLATQLANYPFDERSAHQADMRAKICGSRVRVGLDLDEAGAINRIGLAVSACAVGQSSAAILAAGVDGEEPETLAYTLERIEEWLKGESELPDWPDFGVLAAARERTGRHGALLLPWQAAVAALSSAQSHR